MEQELDYVCVECGANMRLHLHLCPCCGYADTCYAKDTLDPKQVEILGIASNDETSIHPNLDALL